VRPDDGGDAAVEPRREGDLLARRLGVEVDDHDRRSALRLLHEVVDDLPRGHRRLEEELAEQVEDGDCDPVLRLHDRKPAAGRLCSGVRGTDHALARGEVGADPAAAVRVVAEGDHVGTRGEELVGELRGDAGAVGGVLAVDDREIGFVALAQRRQVFLHGAAPGDAEDVREEEDLQLRVPLARCEGRRRPDLDGHVVAGVVRVMG